MALFSESLQNHKLYRLLRCLAEGDETAMDELYRDYSGFIYFHIMNMTDNKSIAEEILQEVFLHLAMLDAGPAAAVRRDQLAGEGDA